MTLAEKGSPLSQALCVLTTHCEAILAENEMLKSKLFSQKAPRQNELLKSVSFSDEMTLPGDVPEPVEKVWPMPDRKPSVGFGFVEAWQTDEDEEGDNYNNSNDGKRAGAHKALQSTNTLAGTRVGMLNHPRSHEAEEEDLANWSLKKSLWGAVSTFHENKDSSSDKDPLAKRIVHSFCFKGFATLAIVVNTVYMGALADFTVKNQYRRVEGKSQEDEWLWPEIFFTSWFTLELFFRLADEGWGFFHGSEARWNLFDGLLVLNSLSEFVFTVSSNLSFLRIFRVFRLVRVIRLVRTVKALKSLRTMVYAMMNSFICLLWAFVMIGLVMFIFSMIFGNAVASFFQTLDLSDATQVEKAKNINEHFGSSYETMVSLFAAISGGNDWMFYGTLLRMLNGGEFFFICFAFYIGFCVIGLLNVVTGIFVDAAVMTRTEDEVVATFQDDEKRINLEVRKIFKDADQDCSGQMTYDEFSTHLKNPRVRAYLSGLDIDASEAGIIFTLMDMDGDNMISIDEFVDGTMRLKGHAKSIDVLSMMFDSARFSHKFGLLCSFLEDQLKEIKESVKPGVHTNEIRMFPPAQVTLSQLNEHSKLRPTLSSHHIEAPTISKPNALV
mmetsp:Transcript_39221/g.63371  ORF Transcript_39221/g.63371 Transcript_39221/m.63371 type:complete len:611 (+) Transcript_39221:140-1972(+)